MQKNYIIIGASAAGIGAMKKLHELDPEAHIVCISAERDGPYNRCLLADYLSGDHTEKQIRLSSIKLAEEENIELRLGIRVELINPIIQSVTCSDGQTFKYDKLFLGIGKKAFIPPISISIAPDFDAGDGIRTKGVFSFFDLKDVNQILNYIREHNVKQSVVVGAGLTGLECADSLNSLGLEVTVIERAEHVLPSQIDASGAFQIEQLMTKNNVCLIKKSLIKNINSKKEYVSGVTLNDSTKLKAQLVVFATGGRPNIDLPQSAGLEIQDAGLVVNEFMQTSSPNIYAGGDICRVKDQFTGNFVQSCLWPDAVMQGMIAANNMAGTEKKYTGAFVITSSNVFNTTFVTCGPVSQASKYESIVKKEKDFYHRFIMNPDGTLAGFVMVGNITNVGRLRRAIVQKQFIDKF